VPCGYLVFSPAYDETAAEARNRGWLVQALLGQHLHQLVDPDATADQLIAISDNLPKSERSQRSH
jgi:hypothetical protein